MKRAPVLSYSIIKAPSKHSNRANEGNGHLTKIHEKYFQLAFYPLYLLSSRKTRETVARVR